VFASAVSHSPQAATLSHTEEGSRAMLNSWPGGAEIRSARLVSGSAPCIFAARRKSWEDRFVKEIT
jgi:hypothetical protein